MMRRALLAFAFATLSAIHCASPERRSGFADEPDAAPASTDGGDTKAGGFGGDAALPDASRVCNEDIDVVLALDVSSSMGFVLDKLEAEIGKVVDAANELKAGAHFGLVLFVDNVRIDTTGSEGGGAVHLEADTLKAAFRDAKRNYTEPNRNPGDGPSGPTTQNPICEENALDALHEAATKFPWRANAAHIVIVATDDTFLERADNYGDRDGDGKTDKLTPPREGDYPARSTVPETVTALKVAGAHVFSFTRLKPPGLLDLQKCGTGRRHKTDAAITYGWSRPYGEHDPIPDQTGGLNYDLDAVRSGSLSLAATIEEIVLDTHCGDGPR